MRLYVITAPRPGGVSYLDRTLRLLDLQSWTGPKIVWSDGPVPALASVPAGWEVSVRPRRGPPNTHAFWDLLGDAAGDDAVILEDDVEPCAGALPLIEAVGAPHIDLAYVSWFDPITKAGGPIPGTVLVPASRILPMQARTYGAGVIATLLAAGPGPRPEGGADACVARALGTGRRAAVVSPSLFQHVGHVSAVGAAQGLTGDRVSASWLGPDVDARHLFSLDDRLRVLGLA